MGEGRNKQVILEIIEKFKSKKVLIIGDAILDIYVYGTALGKSAETPTMVAKEEKTEVSYGGSSLVVRNILELGAKVSYIAVIGNDEEAKYYNNFNHANLTNYFIVDKTRRTTIKKRFWIDGYKLFQIDNLDNKDLSPELTKKVLGAFNKEIKNCDIVVIADNRHGMMTKSLIDSIKRIAEENKKKVIVDSQVSQRGCMHEYYKDCHLICLNLREAKELDPDFEAKAGLEYFKKLREKLGSSNLCIKLGEKGSLSLIDEELIENSAIKVKEIDTCGAGDAFLAALSLAEMNNANESIQIANYWAGLSVAVHGVNPPKKDNLIKYISNLK